MLEKHRKIGKYFREKRMVAGLSQDSVSHALGYDSPQMVSNWERGVCSPPIEKLKEIVQLYKMSHREVVNVILKETKGYLERQLRRTRRR